MRERSDILKADKNSSLYLKFEFAGKTYQTKFMALTRDTNPRLMHEVNMMTLEVNKTVFLDIHMGDPREVEEAFARPLEVQLWHKVASQQRYAQPDREEQVGSFFIELNELPKSQNKRIKGHRHDEFLCHEGYFSMYDFRGERVSQERLACRSYLINNSKCSQ